jgi:prepilin-type N-terminal cleavage/methylation domain-containing protein
MPRKRALGFTLLELAIVMILIGIFMGLGISAVDAQQNSAYHSVSTGGIYPEKFGWLGF